MTSSTGEVGVAVVVVGGAVSSLVLRSRAAERRVLGRLLMVGTKVKEQQRIVL